MTNQNQVPNQNPPAPTKSGWSSWMIILLVVGLIAAAMIFYMFFGGGANETTSTVTPEATIPVVATVPPSTETPPPSVEVPTPDPNGVVATALDVIYFRTGPGTQYPAYGLAQPGAQGQVIGKSEDSLWYVVQTSRTDLVPSGYGWVSADYVSISNPNNLEIPVIAAP
jgi:uncharacterized protein YgiM (DUF1202 family)